jgi:hypothetical protein
MTREVRDARLQLFAAAKRRAEEAAAAGRRAPLEVTIRSDPKSQTIHDKNTKLLSQKKQFINQPRDPGMTVCDSVTE